MKRILERTNNEALKAVNEAQTRAENEKKEKQELSRHFNHVMEDVKVIKSELQEWKAKCEEASMKLDNSNKSSEMKVASFEREIEEKNKLIQDLRTDLFTVERSKSELENVLEAMKDHGEQNISFLE
jgi:predicted  nucleic acid-binding Zn-ribbon protein